MAEDHLLGEQDAGNRCIERSRDGAGNAGGEQRSPCGVRELEAGTGGRGDGGAKMHDRAFATGAGAGAERQGAGERAEQSLP